MPEKTMKTFEQIIDSSIAYLVGRTSRSIIKRLSKKFSETDFDVSYEQWSILVHLYRTDGQTQQELAKVAVKDKAAITRLINALERKNLVLRIPDRHDKRSRLIYLTNKAKNFKSGLIDTVKELLEEAQAGVSENEMQSCRKTLNKVFYNFDRLNRQM